MFTISDNFAAYTVTRAGDAGRAWIESLPHLCETLCREWNLVIEGPTMHGGLSLVIPARRGDEACILKLGWVDESTQHEALALSAWNGSGAVRLFASKPEVSALLLGRLDSRRSLQDVGLTEAVTIAGQLLRRLAISPPKEVPPLKEVGRALPETLSQRRERYGRPMSRRLLDQACDLAVQLAPSTSGLLVNYDLFYADILAGKREPWLAIDPKVVAGDLEYGVAQLLWRRLEEMEAQGGLAYHFDALIEAAGLDRGLSRAWTLVRCVDYWLWGVSVGLTEDPARCEVITTWLTEPT